MLKYKYNNITTFITFQTETDRQDNWCINDFQFYEMERVKRGLTVVLRSMDHDYHKGSSSLPVPTIQRNNPSET